MIQPQNGMFTGTNSKQSNAKRSSLKSWIVRGTLLLEGEGPEGFDRKTFRKRAIPVALINEKTTYDSRRYIHSY